MSSFLDRFIESVNNASDMTLNDYTISASSDATNFLSEYIAATASDPTNILDDFVHGETTPIPASNKEFIDIVRDIRGKTDDMITAAEDPDCIYGEISIMYNDFLDMYDGELSTIPGENGQTLIYGENGWHAEDDIIFSYGPPNSSTNPSRKGVMYQDRSAPYYTYTCIDNTTHLNIWDCQQTISASGIVYLDNDRIIGNNSGSNGNSKALNSNEVRVMLNVENGATAGSGFNYSTVTTSMTATANDFLFVDTTGGAITIALPLNPTIGDTICLVDVKSNFLTFNLTIHRNLNTIMGLAENMLVNLDNVSLKLVYSGTDWRLK